MPDNNLDALVGVDDVIMEEHPKSTLLIWAGIFALLALGWISGGNPIAFIPLAIIVIVSVVVIRYMKSEALNADGTQKWPKKKEAIPLEDSDEWKKRRNKRDM